MILTAVNLVVIFEPSQKNFVEVHPALQANFGLQCLMCGKLHELSTPTSYRLKPLRPEEIPHFYIGSIATVVKQTRKCTNCGLISALPDMDEKRLQKGLEKAITRDFVNYHSQARPPFLAQRLVELLKGTGS